MWNVKKNKQALLLYRYSKSSSGRAKEMTLSLICITSTSHQISFDKVMTKDPVGLFSMCAWKCMLIYSLPSPSCMHAYDKLGCIACMVNWDALHA